MQLGNMDIIPIVGVGGGGNYAWEVFSVEANSLADLHQLVAEGLAPYAIPPGGVSISHTHQTGTVDGREVNWYSAVVHFTRMKTRGERDILGRKPKDVPARRSRFDDYIAPPGAYAASPSSA